LKKKRLKEDGRWKLEVGRWEMGEKTKFKLKTDVAPRLERSSFYPPLTPPKEGN
jgi:hypothetical protein